ncbi:phage tail assembly protein [Turicimonas muris]|uniref:phage tail assembly protein n=1 Tax=Turicimonas muris TaxID=1796652 RepID=UPI002675F7C9|nr:phage tail assembly protein [Turicimonas muris]
MDYVLKTPITVSGNKIEKVNLREPTFDEICEIGLPSDASEDQRLKMMRKYLVVCSGLPDEAVGVLKLKDAMQLLKKMSDFFTDTE